MDKVLMNTDRRLQMMDDEQPSTVYGLSSQKAGEHV